MNNKKKNIFDTEIEMIDLDSIGDLEFRYEELGSPNPELSNDINMVMKETQVFSSDDIEKALEKNAVEDMGLDLGQTRVIDSVEEVEGFLSDDEVAETVNEEVYEVPESEQGTDTFSGELNEAVSEEAQYEESSEENSDGLEYAEEVETEEYAEDNTEYAVADEDSEVAEESEEPEYEMTLDESEEQAEEEYQEAVPAEGIFGVSGSEEIKKLEEDESYDFEEEDPGKKNREKFNKAKTEKSSKNISNNKAKNKKKRKAKRHRDEDSEGGFGFFEFVGVLIAVALIVLLAVLGTKMFKEKLHKEDVAQFASIGVLFSDIDTVGNEGIEAIGTKAYLDSITVSAEEIKDDVSAEEKEEGEEEEEDEKEEVAPISVNFSSIEKDLKIKFVDKNTGKLVTGVRFEVSAKGPNGKTFNWVDTDLDGVIYVDNLEAGNYEVRVISVEPYEFPETATIVKVQDTVVYQVINVIEEAVDMSQVNLAQEENQVKEVDEGKVLQDTVKLVESTATPIDGKDGFVKVNKNEIKDPKTLASAFIWGGFRRVDDITLNVGETKTPVILQPGETVSWDVSGANGVVTADTSGSIKGVAAGTGVLVSTTTKDDGTPGEPKSWNVTVVDNTPVDIKVASITIIGKKDITVGESLTLSAAVSPEDATNKKVNWNLICDEGVASISANDDNTCVVTGNKKGTVSVIAVADDGSGISGSEGFNIDDASVLVSDVKIESSTSEVQVNQTIALKATASPENASNRGITWSSSDQAVATVDDSGNVTGVAPGTATITATAADGSGKAASVNITVKAASALKLTVTGPDGKEITGKTELYVEQTLQLVSKVEGYQSDANVKYAASNDCVTVSATGLITAVKEGTSDISITTVEKGADGKQITKTVSVTVKNDPTKNTTQPLKLTKDGKEYQLYYKTSDNKYVEAKWADYYKYNEFYIKGEVEYKYTGWQTLEGSVYYFTEEGKKVTGEQVIGGAKYNFASDGSLVKDSGSRGIDVSAYQGTIDWTAVKNSGISFVIIRCGFRGYTQGGLILDSKYKSYIQGATSAGLKVGLYIFSQAVNEKEAVEEASLCVNLAQGYRISYPIFIDSEYSNGNHNGRADGLDKGTRTAVCRAFCETIKSAGYTPGVYASKSWYYNKLDVSQLNSYKIWLAHYCGETDYSGKYDLWQHTSKGQVSGIKGNVDLDISYLGY